MKFKVLFVLGIMFAACLTGNAGEARWITADAPEVDSANTWVAFQKTLDISKKPRSLTLDIAADSKYWLWVNGEEVVFEGSLKRGPSPESSYFDRIDIAPYLKKGENRIAVLLWHFGKEGFSHKNSGKSGLIIKSPGNEAFNTNSSWISRVYDAYDMMGEPLPNFRLAESSLRFDASKEMPDWQTADCGVKFGFTPSVERGAWGDAPWGNLVLRPIPQWKDFGMKELAFERRDAGNGNDSIIARFPYNLQMTPWFDIEDPVGGRNVVMETDHFMLNEPCLRAEYVTRQGRQTYESLGWLSGEELYLILPKDVTVHSLKYRETGYDGHVAGKFHCSDEFFNRFWDKAMRTIYVNMRDTWFDCPERERAQWWGDVTVIMGEVFYSYSHSTHKLLKKGIHELCAWQKPDGVLFSPAPAGNYSDELPAQMLASIGRYGFWHYYMNTGDRQIINEVYPHVKKYLSLYKTDETGLTAYRKGGWNWGDWGDNRDMRLLYAAWHYIALDAAAQMADLIGLPGDAESYRNVMADVKRGFDLCWNGYAYRHPSYHDATDDRVQALAVVSGIAGPEKYGALTNVLMSQEHASPYMEKYVMEALFKMGEGEKAIARVKKRYKDMIDHPEHTTLFEGWMNDGKVFLGGTVNHAWSGGPVTMMGEFLCGVTPLEAGWKLFKIDPQPASVAEASITVPSVAGDIVSSYKKSDSTFELDVVVPEHTVGMIYLPTDDVNAVNATSNRRKQKLSNLMEHDTAYAQAGKLCLRLTPGNYKFNVSTINPSSVK